MSRPSADDIKTRALGIIEETMAYPEASRPRLLEIKRGAIQQLVDDASKNAEVIGKYYPGYQAEDFKALLGFLPKGKSEGWHL